METETEAKIKLADANAAKEVIGILDEIAEFKSKRFEINEFYDTAKKKHKKNDEFVRLRTYRSGRSEKYAVTFKGKKIEDKYKSREEFEVEVSDSNEMKNILIAMGYEKVFSFEKKRITYELIIGNKKCLVEIDELPLLGFYCEVEGNSNKTIDTALKHLELSKEKPITTGYVRLLQNLTGKGNKSVPNITFS